MQISIGYVRINISYLFHRFYDYPEYCFSSNSFCSVIRHYTSSNIIKMKKLLLLALPLLLVSCNEKVADSVEFRATYKNCVIIDKFTRGNTYIMEIYKPYIDKRVSVKVPNTVYLHMGFVGDTIR